MCGPSGTWRWSCRLEGLLLQTAAYEGGIRDTEGPFPDWHENWQPFQLYILSQLASSMEQRTQDTERGGSKSANPDKEDRRSVLANRHELRRGSAETFGRRMSYEELLQRKLLHRKVSAEPSR